MWPVDDSKFPLMERVDLVDPTARIFLMDKPQQLVGEDNSKNNSTASKPLSTLAVWKPVVEEEKIPQEVFTHYLTINHVLVAVIG